ncbi:MAG: alpha/beta fold hydrolase [Pseudomonadota bacterium]
MPTTLDGTSYELSGPAGAPCVVLIHGLGLNQACWQWTRPALDDAYRVLSYDLFGHGQSADPVETPSLSVFSRQLQALLDQCGIDAACIAGFSLGGMIARRFAQDCPGRVRALIVLHSSHKRSDAAQAAVVDRVVQARAQGADAMVKDALERWFTPAYRAGNPQMMDLVQRWITANRREIYHLNYHVLATGVDEVVAPDPPISCPALVITGDQDSGSGPEMARAIAAEIDGAQAVILKGLRHMALAEDPDSINQPVRRFLDGLGL